jgi:hypothetical protein
MSELSGFTAWAKENKREINQDLINKYMAKLKSKYIGNT